MVWIGWSSVTQVRLLESLEQNRAGSAFRRSLPLIKWVSRSQIAIDSACFSFIFFLHITDVLAESLISLQYSETDDIGIMSYNNTVLLLKAATDGQSDPYEEVTRVAFVRMLNTLNI